MMRWSRGSRSSPARRAPWWPHFEQGKCLPPASTAAEATTATSDAQEEVTEGVVELADVRQYCHGRKMQPPKADRPCRCPATTHLYEIRLYNPHHALRLRR